MECIYHPGTHAGAHCVACGKPACGACVEEIAGHPMCRPCVATSETRFAAEAARTPSTSLEHVLPPSPATWQAPPPAVPEPAAPYNTTPPPKPLEIEGLPAEPVHYLKGFGFGFVAAIVVALIWSKFALWTGLQWGFVAVILSVGVAIVIRAGAENRSGTLLSVIGALLCGASVLLGYIFLAADTASGELARLPWLIRFPIAAILVPVSMSPMVWIFVAFAAWEGWSIPRQKTVVQPGIRDQILQGIPERLEFGQAYPDQYPQLDRETFQQWTEQLQELGFQWASDYRPANAPASWPPGIARLFVHPEQRCYAEVAQVFPANGQPIGPWCAVLSYMEADWQLATSNVRHSDPATYLMRRPRSVWSRHPEAGVPELFRLHLERRQQIARDLGTQPAPAAQAVYFEQQNRDSQARRAVVAGMTDAQLILEYREAQANTPTEWWGDYSPAATQRLPTPTA